MAIPTSQKSANCKRKKRYPAKENADRVIDKAWRGSKFIDNLNLKRPIRSYLCPKCDGWHMTSKPLSRFGHNNRVETNLNIIS